MLRMMIAMKTRAPVAAALAPRTQPTLILPRGLISREQTMSPATSRPSTMPQYCRGDG